MKLFQTNKLFLVLFVILFGCGEVQDESEPKPQPSQEPQQTEKPYTVKVDRVIDGDTFVVTNGDTTKVRLIGIDTPEEHYSDKLENDAERTNRKIEAIQQLGRKASEYVKHLVEGKSVELTFDPSNEKFNHEGIQGGLMAYVWVLDESGERKFMVNRKLVRDGYAYAYTDFPFQYEDEFTRLEWEFMINRKLVEDGHAYAYTDFPFQYELEFARVEWEAWENKKGLWGTSPHSLSELYLERIEFDPDGKDRDCSDFDTHAKAQWFFEVAGADDPHGLDKDGDGVVCEGLP